jgi:signal transduction histidine kinase
MPEPPADLSRLMHDLNNDLGVIVGHLDLALRKPELLPPAMVRRLEAIKRAAERMTGNVKRAQISLRSQQGSPIP